MKTGEKLFRFLAGLMLERFQATATIRSDSGKVTHVETEIRRAWQYNELPAETKGPPEVANNR